MTESCFGLFNVNVDYFHEWYGIIWKMEKGVVVDVVYLLILAFINNKPPLSAFTTSWLFGTTVQVLSV